MERDGLSGIELIAVVVGGTATLLVGVIWLGAAIALAITGEAVDVSLRDAASALGGLPGNVVDPAEAWPRAAQSTMPGPLVYWPSTFAAVGAATGAGVGAFRVFGGSRVGTARRRVLGVDSKARFATGRDLTSLLVRQPAPGRFVVARFGRRLVATEAPSRQRQRRAWWGRGARWGNRGAVALVGPSQCGKTTAAVAGILEWDGPAVLSSVKADLMGPTVGWRERLGDVRVYDPTASTGRAATGSWSPIYQSGTITGAQRSARALCNAAPRDGVEGGMDFWLAQAEILLSALLYVAHHTHQHMRAVANWVLLQDRPTEEHGPGEVRTLLDMLLSARDRDLVAATEDVVRGLAAVWNMEDRTRSSVYATAQTVVWPWSDPGVAAASRGDGRVDLDWLLGGSNTVYLCAPIEDQKRLAPAFGGLLNDLVAQTYRRVTATGKTLDPPLLVVIDEAGNTPLRQLPEYASTLSGIGVLLVTIWQSLAQIEATYGRSSSTILTNHLTKLFYSGPV